MEIVEEVGLITCEREVIGQRARLLVLLECTGRSCSDEVHMEEERVEVKVQTEEKEIGETHGREQGEEKGENKQSLGRMTLGWDDAHQHLSQCGITHHYTCAP